MLNCFQSESMFQPDRSQERPRSAVPNTPLYRELVLASCSLAGGGKEDFNTLVPFIHTLLPWHFVAEMILVDSLMGRSLL